MATYGFAIDLRKCIGCHACTIACKAEHQIPIGVNRCWVKTVEKGTFPDAQRFFFPVLCNQCTDAPCVAICPTQALYKRRDGIVDLHGDRCIGCRACMEACPYDQLFIDPNTRTAEKCNFCANRVENKLLPACVSVCPTECRIFGDLDDPASEVARIVQQEAFDIRKPEKGTGPRVFYSARTTACCGPRNPRDRSITRKARCTCGLSVRRCLIPNGPATPESTTTCRTESRGVPTWSLYLFLKAVSTGCMLVAAILWLLHIRGSLVTMIAPVISIASISLTAVVLILDLDRPERFYYILTRSNWRSWMVWGAWFLTAHGALSALWLISGWSGSDAGLSILCWPVIVIALLATSYTGLLFAQGLARDLWQGHFATIDLAAQSGLAGSATLLLARHDRRTASHDFNTCGTCLAPRC